MFEMIFEYVAPSGAGKTYHVTQLDRQLGNSENYYDIRTRYTDNLDAARTFIKTFVRIKYITTLIFRQPIITVRSLRVIYAINCKFNHISSFTKVKLTFTLFYNLAYVFSRSDKNTCLLLDQGPFQVLTSYAVRNLNDDINLEGIVKLLIELLPEKYYVIDLAYDVKGLRNNLIKRNSHGDKKLISVYYENPQKVIKTTKIFRRLHSIIRNHNKIIKHEEIERLISYQLRREL